MNLILQPDPSYLVTQGLFLKLRGGGLLASASLLTQLTGLYGSRGLLSINDGLAFARGQLGGGRKAPKRPSPFWFSSSDHFLKNCAY